jgi:lipoprotein-anchoring transpeptidase ErfK/SrfK
LIIGVVALFCFTDFDKSCKAFYINGIDCSNMTADQIVDKLEKNYAEREYKIKVNTEEYSCKAEDLVDVEVQKEYVQKQIAGVNWYRYFFTKDKIELNYSDYYVQNDEKLTEYITENVLSNAVASTDAYIERKAEDDFEIIEDVTGTEFDITDKLLQSTFDSVKAEESEIDYTEYCKKAEVLSDNEKLVKKLKKINKYLDTVITMTFGDETKVIDKETLKNYIDDKGKVSYTWLDDYVKELADELYSVGKTRKFKTHSGKKVKVSGGIYGCIVNQEETVKALKKAIKKGGQVDFEPVYTQSVKTFKGNQIGKTYVEVDISGQMVYYYKKGKCVFESQCVTGLESDSKRKTIRGTHYVMYKAKDTYLKGATWNTHVDYFIPFNYDGQGFHDASWRSVFGGSIYLSNGSHGCVNMPPAKAKELYELLATGTPVVVY